MSADSTAKLYASQERISKKKVDRLFLPNINYSKFVSLQSIYVSHNVTILRV